MCSQTACCSTHTHISSVHLSTFTTASPRNGQQPTSPGCRGGGKGREGPPSQPHMHTRTHAHTLTPSLWISVSLPSLFGPTARSLIYGSCRTRDQREGPTCISARKVFAEPATKSRLTPGSLSVVDYYLGPPTICISPYFVSSGCPLDRSSSRHPAPFTLT